MKKFASIVLGIFAAFAVYSCNNEDVMEPALSDTQTDMEVLSRFVDVNEATNEYYINENKKTRALSYVTGSDWEALEKVSPLSVEKYKRDLQTLNAQVASAISNPNVAYMVFSVNGKTLVKKLRDSKFGFEKSSNNLNASRSIPTPLQIYGGQQTTTQQFYDSSRTINMNVNLSSIVQNNYYFFEVLSPDAKPNNDDNISTPESVAFSGSGPLWNSSFVWTAYWDVNVPGKGFKWEFRGKGTSPSSGFIADCTFSK